MRVDLGKSRWAEILDADEMPHSTAVAVDKLYPVDRSLLTAEWYDSSRDELLAHVITSWSFDQEIPNGDRAKLGFVPHSAHDALLAATGEHWEALGFTDPKKKSSAESSNDTASTSG